LGTSPGDVTIILVTYNSARVVANALDSLPPESRVICVDNNSADETPAVLGRYPVEVVRNAENVGYGRACNQAARLASGNFLLIMNPDVVLNPATVPALLAASEMYPEAAVYLPFTEDARGNPLFRDQSRIEAWDPAIPNGRKVVPVGDCCTRFADGSVFMIRRDAYDRIGGFDPSIFLYYEDDDLSFRLMKEGIPIVLVRDAGARHLVSQSSPPASLSELAERNAHKKISEYYVRAKHGQPRARSADAVSQIGRMLAGVCRLDVRTIAESYGRLRAVVGMGR
jgi:GT2 family glycosyltransferase